MALFPYFWLAGAGLAAICIWAGAGELLLLHWAAVSLYLLSFLRWHRIDRSKAGQAGHGADMAELCELDNQALAAVSPVSIRRFAGDSRFGGRGPDDLQQSLLLHCVQLEERMRRLQVNTL